MTQIATRPSSFRKANRAYTWLKIGIEGPSGAGKTMGALLVAKGLATSLDRVAFVDTENGSGELYSDHPLVGYSYMYSRLDPPFAPTKFIELIKECVAAGVEVMIIDSQSHAWKYILGYKDALDQRGGNSFTNWGKVKPMYEELKNAILFSPMHIIVTMRSKSEYSLQENGQGKKEVLKLGTNPIAEPENEYEFSVVMTVDKTNMATTMLTGKDRTGLFGDVPSFRITEQTGQALRAWLETSGTPTTPAEWTQVLDSGAVASQAAERELSGQTRESFAASSEPAISPEGQILKVLLPSEGLRREFKAAMIKIDANWKAVVNAGPTDETPDAFKERISLLVAGNAAMEDSKPPVVAATAVDAPSVAPAEDASSEVSNDVRPKGKAKTPKVEPEPEPVPVEAEVETESPSPYDAPPDQADPVEVEPSAAELLAEVAA